MCCERTEKWDNNNNNNVAGFKMHSCSCGNAYLSWRAQFLPLDLMRGILNGNRKEKFKLPISIVPPVPWAVLARFCHKSTFYIAIIPSIFVQVCPMWSKGCRPLESSALSQILLCSFLFSCSCKFWSGGLKEVKFLERLLKKSCVKIND